MRKRRILVAPLNWGLGHATRCIPIIRKLEEHQFEPVIASDGPALQLLKKEFPHLKSYDLPSYNITYTTKGSLLKWKLLMRTPCIVKSIKREKVVTRKIVEKENISGIISDSRFGVRYKHIPNVFVTHQLNVLSGNTTYLSSRLHQILIKKFDECWVPDAPAKKNLSGFLGQSQNQQGKVHYMGILSRFEKKNVPVAHDVMVLLSGPEPQRTLLEEKLLTVFKNSEKKVLFVRGVISETSVEHENVNLNIHNYMWGKDLEKALNSSKLVVARSGYTTIMDLARLEKKAFFIPTPGQFEQEYLATRMKNLGMASFCSQKNFQSSFLVDAENSRGLSYSGFVGDFSKLFGLFQSK
jgi:uncharacterized protein (TIGR00661 family)